MENLSPREKPLRSVIIVGAGWAGLSCALQLSRHDFDVTIIEASKYPGGRARSIPFGNYTVDNGQHLLLDAYVGVKTILKWLNISKSSVFERRPLQILFKSPKIFTFTVPLLPAPINFLLALMFAKGIKLKDKFFALKFFYYLKKNNFHLDQDLDILSLLLQHKQSLNLIQQFWEPLALAALSTPIAQASAKIFIKVLQDSFQSKYNSNCLFPKQDLSNILPIPITQYLLKNHAEICYSQSAKKIIISNNYCLGVSTKNQNFLASNIVLAIPPWRLAALIEPHAKLKSLHHKISQINYQPIITIYFTFPKKINLPYPMLGLLNGPGQWVFDKSISGQPNMLSVVISGLNQYNSLSNYDLTAAVYTQLQITLPAITNFLDYRVVREKRAAFSCDTNIQQLRPSNITPIKNLYLAGDHTDTPYPATLEGAVQSGLDCADILLKSYNQQ
jgi:hydroxysqualene dehydroxylase